MEQHPECGEWRALENVGGACLAQGVAWVILILAGLATVALWRLLPLPQVHAALDLKHIPPGNITGVAALWVATAIVGTVVAVLAHEGVHGLIGWIVGARPRFGFHRALLAPYTTFGERWLTRWQYIAVALAPFVVITLLLLAATLALPTLVWPLTFVVALHASGCIGDFWMVLAMLRLPPDTEFQDTAVGYRWRRRGA